MAREIKFRAKVKHPASFYNGGTHLGEMLEETLDDIIK